MRQAGPVTVARLQVCTDRAMLVLRSEDAVVPLQFSVPSSTALALRHVIAVEGHADGRPAPTPFIGKLVHRAIAAAEAQDAFVVVQPSSPPAFWLRMDTSRGVIHLDLDVVEAVALLLSRVVPAVIEHAADSPLRDWDGVLRQLIEDAPSA